TPFLAAMREREPAMRALAKRVQSKSTSNATISARSGVSEGSGGVEEQSPRGPRNQPKRQKQKGANKGGKPKKKR
ncbi:MAG: hypothetical protein ACKN8W_05605, partial [Actinomycetales bacterium]